MREAGVVVDKLGAPIHWHLPQDRSVGALPDSRRLWDVLWDNRDIVLGFAHTHPGSGVPAPSWTDITTFSAIEGALGRRLDWWILSRDRIVLARWAGPDPHDYGVEDVEVDPVWALALRAESCYGKEMADG